jgi:hydrogenase nickel incorporation protein HypA/HybF
MHEIGIMEHTLAMAITSAKEQNANRINKITMNIGKLSGVIPDALEFAFEVLRQGTIAENATLTIKTIPVVCYCDSCQENFSPPEWFFECPHCHQFSNHILQGKEMELMSVEIDYKS